AVVLLTSGDPEDTDGLAELADMYYPKVVAPPVAREAISKACPVGTTVLSAEDLVREPWSPLRGIPLGGRGVGPTAYLLQREGKAVLFTGRIPLPTFLSAGVDLRADF